jgi:2-polyprenyl-3-methyl-5-hydroxy-6-metoxy-1,4-benzoquinol methylase
LPGSGDAASGRRFGQSTWDEQVANLQAVVGRFTADRERVRVLEAGCGQYPSPLGLEGRAQIVGIDVSRAQLERNDWADEKILGDITAHDLAADDYDVIACWDVLEHLPEPQLALDRFVHAVRPGGLVVIKVPNVLSAKGLITKLSPHWFHVLVYKHVFGYTDPGKDDRPPFPTFLRLSIAPKSLRRFAERRGMHVEMCGTYEADKQESVRSRVKLKGPVWRLARGLVRLVTFRFVDPEATELIFVMRKAAA